MKKTGLLFSLLFIITQGLAQPYSVGHRTITFNDPSRNNRSIPTEIYYPANTAGDNVPVAGIAGDAFPLLVFGHGFVMAWDAYDNIWNAVVPAGYIIAFPKTETGFSPNHTEFAKDIAFLVFALQAEGQNPSSPFYQKIDSTSCVMGHSMGGGSSFLSVQYNSNITAVANLAAAETNPSAVAACANISIPSLLLIGGNDCITPPANHQLPMYNALGASCKTAVTITGGSHCYFANYNFNCAFGELTCSPAPAITRAQQHAAMNSLLIPWLDYQLKGDCNAWNDFQNLLTAAQGISSLQNCTACIPSSVLTAKGEEAISVFPIPATGYFFIRTKPGEKITAVKIYHSTGKKVNETMPEQQDDFTWKIDSKLIPGLYLLEIISGEKKTFSKAIIQ